jgi:WD40 repeat protein
VCGLLIIKIIFGLVGSQALAMEQSSSQRCQESLLSPETLISNSDLLAELQELLLSAVSSFSNELLQVKKMEMERQFGKVPTALIFRTLQERLQNFKKESLAEVNSHQSETAPKTVRAKSNPQIYLDFDRPGMPAYSARFSNDGTRILSSHGKHGGSLWDWSSGQKINSLKAPLLHTEFSPDDQLLVSSMPGARKASVIKTETGEVLWSLENGHQFTIYTSQFSPDGQKIVTASGDRTAIVWSMENGQSIGFIKRKMFGLFPTKDLLIGLRSSAYSPDGRYIVTVKSDHETLLADAKTLRYVRKLPDSHAKIHLRSWTPDGRYLLLPQFYNLKRWDSLTDQAVNIRRGSTKIFSAIYSRDGKIIIIAGADGVTLLDAQNFAVLLTFSPRLGSVLWADLDPSNTYLLISSDNDFNSYPPITVSLWKLFESVDLNDTGF